VLRLDLLLLVGHQLHGLSGFSHTCEEEDVTEVRSRTFAQSGRAFDCGRQRSQSSKDFAPHLIFLQQDMAFVGLSAARLVLQVPPCLGSLSRVASRAAEELAPHLAPRKLSYVCGAVPIAGMCCCPLGCGG
jgi:hypothetical protein